MLAGNSRVPTRRVFLKALLAGSAGGVWPGLLRSETTPRVVVLDWGLTATALALGVAPVGVPEKDQYGRWLSWPGLPPGVADVGLRLQPNLEVIWQLRPDLIVTIDQHAAIRPQLEAIAPSLALPIYTPETQPLPRAVVVTRRLGEVLHGESAAEDLITGAEETFAHARETVGNAGLPPLYLADVLDASSIRLFGRRSLFGNVLQRIGLANAWQQATSYWGSATVGPAKLAAVPEAGWLRVTPLDDDLHDEIVASPLWTRLPFVEAGRMQALEPVLPFGALPSAMHFARQIMRCLRDGFPDTNGSLP